MARVLVTGATGFTGRYLGPRLAQDGHEVIGLSHTRPDTEIAGYVALEECDLTCPDALNAVIRKWQPSKVVHLAAVAFVAHSDVAEMYRANVLGTRNLLGALAQVDQKPDAVLISSSANVYGNTASGVISEKAPVSPANDYGVTKASVELICDIFLDKLPIIVTRPFNYTGVGQSKSFLIPKIIDHLARKAPLIELGNIDVARDFSDVRYLVDTYAKLLLAKKAVGKKVNVCSGRAVSLSEVLALASRIAEHSLEVRVNPAFVRSDEVKSLCGSRDLLETLIGNTGGPALEDTLRWMLEGAAA
ncbi:NAD-dependent epimerase/dehydratase family protein [Aurantiacibacter suaedae]|uniref:NAD-dependent epimerase/dehydratase family protein n=1 Tax=Aurantiacibacter suaedae TaxID=2545755 RepID=UPI0010F9C386|nr:NAD-dependent epimerase/dehydratase family protein [Aurantiacibacter suaedae]